MTLTDVFETNLLVDPNLRRPSIWIHVYVARHIYSYRMKHHAETVTGLKEFISSKSMNFVSTTFEARMLS